MSELDLLRGMPLFTGLEDEQLRAVLAVVSRQRVEAGTVILSEGDRSNSLFVLTSGSVKVTKRLGFAVEHGWEGPKEKTLVTLAAPRFFGEMGLLEDTERSATVTALSDCELLEVTKADFEQLADADNNFAYRVTRNIAIVLASRLRNTDRDVLKLTMALSLALGNR